MRRFILIIAICTGVLVSGPAMATDDHYCQRYIKTAFVEDLVPGCQPGDALVLTIFKKIAPGTVVGKLCDLRYEVWTEWLAPIERSRVNVSA